MVQALVDRRGIGHIEFHQPGHRTFGLYLLPGPFGFLAQDHVVQINSQARLRQGQGNGPAYAPGTAGHQCYAFGIVHSFVWLGARSTPGSGPGQNSSSTWGRLGLLA